MSRWVHAELSEQHALTKCCRRMIATFREDGEKRFTRSVLHHVLFRIFRSEPIVFHFRFEKAIADLKPTKLKTDPAPDFWTAYKEVADKYDSDLASKYIGDLDITLIFVSVVPSLPCIIHLSQTMLC